MKKKLAILMVWVLMLAFVCGCTQRKRSQETVMPVHVQGSIFGGSSSDNIALELKFDPQWITEEDNTVYNSELAAFSALTLNYCRAALLQSIGRVLAYGQSACDAVHVLWPEEEDICAIADLIMDNAASITGAHRLLNSYMLAGYVD